MKKIIIALTLIFLTCVTTNVYADIISDINKQISDLSAEKKATADKISGLDQELSNYLYDIMTLDDKIEMFSSSLSTLQKKVNDVNSKLKEQESALQNSAQSYNSAEDIYITRLRVIYENGIPSMLDIFLSSQSISDFFSKMNVLTSILEYDKSLVNNMKSQKEYIDYIKSNIEIQKVQLEQLRYDTEKSAAALSDAKTVKENKAKEIQSSKVSLKAKVDDLAKQEEEAFRKRNDELAKLAYSKGSFNGVFAWPVPGFTYISAGFGLYDPWNTGKLVNHSGVDIAGSGIFGKPIVAAESGTVILAKLDGPYGNSVVIDHGTNLLDGANYRTRYGHATSLNVSVNQKVSKGQVIAFVGSTGNSTGPHLHFEVLKNGKAVNPIGYIK
jgi:murein DD-endopeptidase MepM/ murein hydrolase activator NlpD